MDKAGNNLSDIQDIDGHVYIVVVFGRNERTKLHAPSFYPIHLQLLLSLDKIITFKFNLELAVTVLVTLPKSNRLFWFH